MTRVIASVYATLDGRVDDMRQWTMAYDSAAAVEYHSALLRDCGGLLLGRRTYEIFAQLWPAKAGELAYIDRLNALPKHVASTTLGTLGWENSRLIAGSAVPGVAALRAGTGPDLVLYGGPALVRTLLAHGLVDELRMLVHPVLLGGGRGLLGEDGPLTRLTLVDSAVIASGVAVLTYRPV